MSLLSQQALRGYSGPKWRVMGGYYLQTLESDRVGEIGNSFRGIRGLMS